MQCSAWQDTRLRGKTEYGVPGRAQHSAEEELELLGKYYDLDILSWRNAVYPLFRQEVPGFQEW